jgi:hypothetical protein
MVERSDGFRALVTFVAIHLLFGSGVLSHPSLQDLVHRVLQTSCGVVGRASRVWSLTEACPQTRLLVPPA